MSSIPTWAKQIGSVLLTFFVYQLFIGWKVALVLVVGIVWHEYSHILAAKKVDLKTNGMILLPFLGGLSFVGGPYKTYAQQAFVVLGGPAGGAVSAFIAYALYLITGIPFLAFAAYILCVFNLFNLLPLGGVLDGAQLMNSITYSFNRKVGFALQAISTVVGITLLFIYTNPMLAVFVGFIGFSPLYTEYNNQKNFVNNPELCSNDYLDPPVSMNKNQVILTLVGWIITILSLTYLWHCLPT
jgi:Zn-dependent protease